jgi:hypothetical protein
VTKAGLAVAIGTALLATSIVPTDARSAIYEVHACRLPSGTPAPAHGWTTTSAYGPGAVSQINCPGGAMTSHPAAGEHNQRSLLGFSFTAPSGTTIAGYDRHADGVADSTIGPTYWSYGEFGTLVGHEDIVGIGQCGGCGVFTAGWLSPNLSYRLTRLISALRCESSSQGNTTPCQANGSHFSLRWITLRLEDLKAPQVVSASGSLLENSAPQHGSRFLSLKLRDVGGGLLKTRVEVDGQRFSEQNVDDNGGRCKTPFVATVPCKLVANVELPIDTARIAEGHHAISVRVLDATGVNSTLYGPIPIDVDNVPDPKPTILTCPSGVEGKLTRHLNAKAIRFGGMVSVKGRIAGRVSLRGARVALVDLSGARATKRSARVRGDGRFRLRLRPRQSGLVRPVLLAASGVAQLCGVPVRLRVQAGMRFDVTPKRLSNGQSIRMSGRLLGIPVPDRGKTVVLQARAKGIPRWARVTMTRAGASGRFTFQYRFRRTFHQTTYEFRAVSPVQRGYPYARGWSKIRRAVVAP